MYRPVSIFGLAVIVLAVATGCATPPPQSGLVTGSSVIIGESGLLSNLNPGVYGTPGQERAAQDLAELTRPQFYIHDEKGQLAANPNFGSVTRAADGTVTYKLSGKAKWSDGVPVDAADLAVSWLAATDGQAPGYSSYLKRTSLALSDKIQLLPDGVKLHFKQPVPNWQTALPVTVPAHVLGKLAFPSASLTDAAAEKLVTDELTAKDNGVNSGLLAAAFTSAFATTTNGTATTSADENLLLSSGPYNIASATADKVVLVANPNFAAGPKARVEKVILDCFSTPDELAAAVAAKSVDLAAPSPTTASDLSNLASAAKKAGFNTAAGSAGRNEVILFNHASGSAFGSDTWGSNTQQLRAAEQGAFQFMPRAGIWTVLAGTPGLVKSNSLVLATTDPNYGKTIGENGTAAYPFQDAESSVELWQAARFPHTIALRVLFDANSPRGQLEYTQLSRLGKLGGFNVQNISTDNPDAVLASLQWDVYITEQGQLSTDANALSTAIGAMTNFHNTDVDKLVSGSVAGKPLSQDGSAATKLDELLVKNFYGLPLFQLDGLVVWSNNLKNYKPNRGNTAMAWGYSNWSVLAKGK